MAKLAQSSSKRQDGERAHPLSAVDKNALDVSGGGGTGVECCVAPGAEFRTPIVMMDIDDDVGGVEQHDQVLREISYGVDTQFRVAEQDRPRLGDSERGADDREIDIRQFARLADSRNVAVAGDL